MSIRFTNPVRPRPSRLVRTTALLAAGTLALASAGRAECSTVAVPGTPVAGAHFGKSLSWDGDLLIVGAPQDKNASSVVVGAVYLFHRVGSTWTLEARFEGDGNMGVLGDSVAISASGLAAAGRPSAAFFITPGIIRTYRRTGTTWSALATLSDPGGYQDFPTALAMSGNDLMAGCGVFAFSGDGDFAHYHYNGATFTLFPILGGPYTGPIRSIAFSVLTAVLGYPETQTGSETVAVMTRTSTSTSDWFAGPFASLVDGDPTTHGFGRAVAYSPTPTPIIVVGAPDPFGASNGEGAVFVFRKTGSTWAQEQKLVSPLPTASSHFGTSVATNGTTILVGQPGAASGAGRVFVFDAFASAPIWRYSNALLGDGVSGAAPAFGSAVALQGSRGVCGASEASSGTGAATSIDDVHCAINGFCFGDGSGTACPCGNDSAPGSGSGCLNSFGTGGLLAATGVPHVTSDTLQLQLSGSPPTGHAPTFFQGTIAANGGLGTVFGDGLRCAIGTVIRLGTRPSSGGNAAFGFGIAGDPLVSVQGAVPAVGALRYYQVNYRNSLAFCTSATFNLTNGLKVTWSP